MKAKVKLANLYSRLKLSKRIEGLYKNQYFKIHFSLTKPNFTIIPKYENFCSLLTKISSLYLDMLRHYFPFESSFAQEIQENQNSAGNSAGN